LERIRITDISPQKRGKGRYLVSFEGAEPISLCAETLYRRGLRVGDELDERAIREIEGEDELVRAREAALRLLSYRRRTERELYDRLLRKGFSRESVENTVQRMRSLGFLNDLEFAEDWVRQCVERNPMGRRKVEEKLRLKGVPDEIARNVAGRFFSDIDEIALARSLLLKRLWRYRGLERAKALKRMSDFLYGRGFDWETIARAVEEIWRDIEGDEIG